MVTNALESAQDREEGATAARPIPRSNEDVAFAPTILSSAKPDVPAMRTDAAPPTKRVGKAGPPPSPVPPLEESKLTLGSAALEMEHPAGLPKRRGWMWVLLVVAAGASAWVGVRAGGIDRVRSLLGSSTRSTPAVAAPPAPLPAAAPAATPSPRLGTPPPALAPPSSAAASTSAAISSTMPAPTPATQRLRGAPASPKTLPGAPVPAASAPAITPPPEPPPARPPGEEDNPYN